MKPFKKILLALMTVFIGLQFIPSVRNQSGQMDKNDISIALKTPEKVRAVLVTSCYDCHSNNTRHPWYAKIQPVRYMLDKHVKEGKENLNLSGFGSYSTRRKLNKLRSMGNSIRDETMPLSSYTLIHRDATLTAVEKTLLLNWIARAQDSLHLLR